MFVILKGLHVLTAKVRKLSRVWNSSYVCMATEDNSKTVFEVTNKSQIEFGQSQY